MDVNVLRGYITLVTMIAFLGVCWWAYRGRNRARFEEDARLPFADEAGGTAKGAATAIRHSPAAGRPGDDTNGGEAR